jgi:hypothetical protein
VLALGVVVAEETSSSMMIGLEDTSPLQRILTQ